MRKAPRKAGPKAATTRSNKQLKRGLPVLQVSPGIIEIPVENFHRRPMGSTERPLVVNVWWRMRREGVRLPAKPGVIVLEGGRT